MTPWLKKNLPHILAVLFFIVLAFIYCSPVIQGKIPRQSDVQQATAMQREINQYKDAHGNMPFWTNAMFSGMPTFQIGGNFYNANFATHVIHFFVYLFPNPVNLILLYLLGAYLLFSLLKLNVWLAVAASIAVAFPTYNFALIEAGHGNQALAIAFFAPVIAGILVAYRGEPIFGSILTAIFLAIEIRTAHLQMSYYLMIMVLLLVMVLAVEAIRRKTYLQFLRTSAFLAVALAVAVTINITSLLVNKEFAEETIRGGRSELTIKAGDAKGDKGDKGDDKTGLSRDYVYAWSQGIKESITFLVPNAYGGASFTKLDADSETAKALAANSANLQFADQAPTYWGGKPFTSGPIYFGACVFFLFVLGLFLIKGPWKWWLLAATILSILLSWGKNFQSFSDLFYYHFPLYNKFRSVESILVIAQLAVPLLAFLTVQQLAETAKGDKDVLTVLKRTFYVLGGLLLILIILPGVFFDFNASTDTQLPAWLQNALVSDRSGMLRRDSIRSLIFVLITAGLCWFLVQKRLKPYIMYILLGFIVLVDFWGVDKRYLNNDIFVNKADVEVTFTPRPVDEQILKDPALDYRVLDLSVDTYNNARTSYFHKTIGGYNAAKLRRYNELIEFQLSKNNIKVLDMLNTKYIIVPDSLHGAQVRQNPGALGNAWFVTSVQFVRNADEEMNSLNGFDPKEEALVDDRYKKQADIMHLNADPSSTIKLESYRPDNLVYSYTSSASQIAVFSEIYYDKGWNAYVDGKQMPYFRADYVLRAMHLPPGSHKVEFIFHPQTYYTGEKISLAGSFLLGLIVLGWLFYHYRTRRRIDSGQVVSSDKVPGSVIR